MQWTKCDGWVDNVNESFYQYKEVSKMGWFSNMVDKFRQVPDPYFSLHVTAKSLAGVGIGVLLAAWLPVWTGWIFIGVALLIAVPSARIVLTR